MSDINTMRRQACFPPIRLSEIRVTNSLKSSSKKLVQRVNQLIGHVGVGVGGDPAATAEQQDNSVVKQSNGLRPVQATLDRTGYAALLWAGLIEDVDVVWPADWVFWRRLSRLLITGLLQYESSNSMLHLRDAEEVLGESFLDRFQQQNGDLWRRVGRKIDSKVQSAENAAGTNDWFDNSSSSRADQFIQRFVAVIHDHLQRQTKSLFRLCSDYDSELVQVDRITFHLADARVSYEYPFAFMMTYGDFDSELRVVHLPFAQAVIEFSESDYPRLLRLLKPLHAAASEVPWLQAGIDSKQIFSPIAWTTDEAFSLLESVEELQRHNIVVKIPKWARNTGQGLKVSARVELNPLASLTSRRLLEFEVEVTYDGQRLEEHELEVILAKTRGLILLKGKWQIVDSEGVKETLKHWKRIHAEIDDGGLSFHEGLRLVNGIGKEWSSIPPELQAKSEVVIGSTFQDRLDKLTQTGINFAVPKGLNATLRPYQLRGFQWLKFHADMGLGACLADDMGLGKTIQVITLLLSRIENSDSSKNTAKSSKSKQSAKPSLIVVPASLVGNWQREFASFAPGLKVVAFHPGFRAIGEEERKSEKPQFLNDCDVVITSYGMARRIDWFQSVDWDVMVLDEAQAIKNSRTKVARTVKQFSTSARIALTGTPIENGLSDLWSLFDFIAPGLLASELEFSSIMRADDTGPIERLSQVIKPYLLRRLKTDKAIISDLPDKVEMTVDCGLSKKQLALYQKSVEELENGLNEVEHDGMKRRGVVLAFLTRFKQICNHPSLFLGHKTYATKASGKFVQLEELARRIHENGDKLIVFTQYRTLIPALAELLQSVFGEPGLTLHGTTPVKNRPAIVQSFQSDNGPPFIVLSLKAGGTGLNLTRANHVVHFDRWWNPAVEEQATDRAYRIGQHQNVLVHKFVTRGTCEEHIDNLIRSKSALAESVLSGSSSPKLTELNNEDLIALFSLDQVGSN